MSKKMIHMRASVRGMLNWDRRTTQRNLRSITKTDGSRYRGVEEFRDALMDMLANGVEFVPMGECDGFDPKTGCPGHEQ